MPYFSGITLELIYWGLISVKFFEIINEFLDFTIDCMNIIRPFQGWNVRIQLLRKKGIPSLKIGHGSFLQELANALQIHDQGKAVQLLLNDLLTLFEESHSLDAAANRPQPYQ